jgi:hypothetical protein
MEGRHSLVIHGLRIMGLLFEDDLAIVYFTTHGLQTKTELVDK